jgi:flavin-dependent dehydrogenase
VVSRIDTDVLVVGGGPAGSACAIALARAGTRVAVVEAGDFGGMRIGETLAPWATPLLKRLGLRPDWALNGLGRPATVMSAWGGAVSATSSMLNPYGAGWCVDRGRFDHLLVDRAGSLGAALWPRCRVTDARLDGDRWSFTARQGAERLEGTAAFVVEATGRRGRSAFAPSGRRLAFDRLTALAWTVPGVAEVSRELGLSCCVEAVRDGWWYSTPLQGEGILIVFFTDGDLLPRGRAAMARHITARLDETNVTRGRVAATGNALMGWKAFDAGTTMRQVGATANWAAAGDALATVDPLSGQGVALALREGMELAQCLLEPDAERRGAVAAWLDTVAEQFNQRLDEREGVYSRESRWRDSPFWRRRTEGRRDYAGSSEMIEAS